MDGDRPPIAALVPRADVSAVPAAGDDEHYISTIEASEYLGLSRHQTWRNAKAGKYGATRSGTAGKNANATFICVARMPAAARGLFYARYPHLTPPPRKAAVVPVPPPIRSFQSADATAQGKAHARFTILDDYERTKAASGLSDEAWVAQYKAGHPDAKVSVDSLQRWRAKYAAFGMDGLIDGNDGSARRGKSVLPEAVIAFFTGLLNSGDEPNPAEAIRDTRVWAESKGLRCNASDRTFYNIAAGIPDVVRRAKGVHQDDDSKVLATVRRDYSFPALTIVQADHHLSDLFVRCTDGHVWVRSGDRLVQVGVPGVCDGECKNGHRVWLTVFIDVASRMVLAWVASLKYPNAETIKLGVRLVIERFGVFKTLYIDNGKDFISAFGRAIRAGDAVALNEPYFASLITTLGIRVIYAIPYRARAKTIERLFRTWVEQLWKGKPGYVGRVGRRRKRVQARYENPAELSSYADFCSELAVQVDLYNMKPGHRGQGMNGRSPLVVFAATRIPPQKPEPIGFAIAFWLWFGRQVQNGGAVSVGYDRYRVPVEIYATLPRKSFVQLLVDPADIRHAILLSGCKHTKSSATRDASYGCGCSGKGRFLGVAPMWDLSKYDSDHPITIENYRLLGEYNRELTQRINSFTSPAVQQELTEFRRNRMALYSAMVQRLALEGQPLIQQALGSNVAATTMVLPQTALGRAAQKFLADASKLRGGLTDEQQRLAQEALLEARVQRVPAAPRPRLVAAAPVDDDAVARSRELRGFCGFDSVCPNARTKGSPYCDEHQKEVR